MTPIKQKTTAVTAGTTIALAAVAHAADSAALDEFMAKMRSADDKIRGPAWQGAAAHGAPAVKPLGGLLTDLNFEIARSAKRALYVIVRHAGRPGAAQEARAVERALIPLLRDESATVRREVAWMLSEIGGSDAVAPLAALLTDKDVREDARCALTRLPGRKATAALRSAFASAPEDFRFALAESLRKRGEKVEGYPSQKLVPTRSTTVTPPKPA